MAFNWPMMRSSVEEWKFGSGHQQNDKNILKFIILLARLESHDKANKSDIIQFAFNIIDWFWDIMYSVQVL